MPFGRKLFGECQDDAQHAPDEHCSDRTGRQTIEAVYRPTDDPSRTPRDLERASPPGSPGQLRAEQLLAALKDKLGVTNY
jgi:hypothetical protein